MRKHNFAAGPAVLPEAVLEELKNELPKYKNIGTSVLEISHRSATYDEITASARATMRRLLGIGEEWHILFMQGGASMQFHQVPLNFLPNDGSADYLVTGAWAKKAVAEGKFLGNVRTVADGSASNFSVLPQQSELDLDENAAFLHYTSNNTIFGTQYRQEPDAGSVKLVCDASSDFMCRPLDMEKYGMIYAGAQKNMGPAGTTIVLIHDDFLKTKNNNIATLLDYKTHTDKLFHTPPVMAVYLVEKVLRWLEGQGGLEAIAKQNEKKAGKLYARLDKNDFYAGTADVNARSWMNVCFRLGNTDLEAKFIEESVAAGMIGLKGHRSVGGMRASIYNACPPESVDALIAFMDKFEAENS